MMRCRDAIYRVRNYSRFPFFFSLNLNLNLAIFKMKIAVLIFFFIFSSVLFSQSYLVHTYSEAEGLPSANVYGITQDHQGRMWFATRGGIAVYDGVSWKTYTVSDDLPELTCTSIKVDQKGKVWALSIGGLGRFTVSTMISGTKIMEMKSPNGLPSINPKKKSIKRRSLRLFN